jgi:hypothetical protein
MVGRTGVRIEGLRLANALSAFWRIRGHLAEGREWLARLLDAAPIDRHTRGVHAACTLPPFGDTAGRLCRREATAAGSLALFREIDDPNGRRALCALAWLSIEQGDYPEAEARSREAIGLLASHG